MLVTKCTIILPWGKYTYKNISMGIAGSLDIFWLNCESNGDDLVEQQSRQQSNELHKSCLEGLLQKSLAVVSN